MAKPGPTKTPTAILKLHGSWRAKGRPDEKGLSSEMPRMPARVGRYRYAKAFWKANVPFLMELGLMTMLDPIQFTEMCIVFHRMRVAEDLIDADGNEICLKRGTNQMVTHPAVARYEANRKEFLKIADKFGCAPTARASLQLEIKNTGKKTGKEKYFGKKFGS